MLGVRWTWRWRTNRRPSRQRSLATCRRSPMPSEGQTVYRRSRTTDKRWTGAERGSARRCKLLLRQASTKICTMGSSTTWWQLRSTRWLPTSLTSTRRSRCSWTTKMRLPSDSLLPRSHWWKRRMCQGRWNGRQCWSTGSREARSGATLRTGRRCLKTSENSTFLTRWTMLDRTLTRLDKN